MSPRAKRLRRVVNPPEIKGFRPYGPDIKKTNQDPVVLLFEEYEALRLCDYDMYNHHKASDLMGVSRPTFTRIYAQARQKIASAFVEGRTMTIEGGKVYFDSDWYHCLSCGCYFNNPEKEKKIHVCPLCRKSEIVNYDPVDETDAGRTFLDDHCVCSVCGNVEQHRKGVPCHQQKCSACGAGMRKRKNKCSSQ